MNKIKAVTDMPQPTDKKAVQRALGMVNYMGRFVPNLAAKTVALRQLLQSNTEWSWHQTHDKEWKEIKDILSTEPVLVFFDPSKKTRISTEASKDGLGAILLQDHDGDWKPVAYAARSMTETEQRYAQKKSVWGSSLAGTSSTRMSLACHTLNLRPTTSHNYQQST